VNKTGSKATMVALTGAVWLLGTTGGSATAQEPATARPQTFGSAVDVIRIDAVVTDKQGRTVNGLTGEDFVVREDGNPQMLTSFEAVELAPATVADTPPALSAAPRSSSNEVAAESPRRAFLIVMDDDDLGLAGGVAARKAAHQFLSDVARPGDLVSMIVPGAGLTWSAQLPEARAQLASIVESVKGRRAVAPELATAWEARQVAETSDPVTEERMRVRLDSSGVLPRPARLPGESDEDYEAHKRVFQQPFVQAEARRQLNDDRDRRRRLFEAVSTALESVSSVKGRKSVLLLSEGFIAEPNDPLFRDLVAAARRNNACFYFLDVQPRRSGAGADSRTGDRSASTHLDAIEDLAVSRGNVVDPLESGGADAVAEDTGGFSLHNPNDLEAALARVAAESSSYYLLGYSPSNAKRDGRYRRLSVEVRRAGLTVRARRGYYAPADDTRSRPSAEAKVLPELEHTFASALPERQIPLRLTALTLQPVNKGRVRVRLVAEIGLAPQRFEKQGDGSLVAALDVAMGLNHVDPAGRQRTPWREWKVRLPQKAAGAMIWVPLEGTFDVPAGACQARVAVRDQASHAVGSVVHGFEVPDPKSWRVSTPILSDLPGEELGSPPHPRVSRTFVASAPLYCYLEVYSGTRKGSAPRVSLAYTLVDAQGKIRKVTPASPVTPGSAGVPARLETIPLSGLRPGQYELRLSVHDEASGSTLDLREPFVVRRPARADLATYLGLLEEFLAGDVARASSGILEGPPHDLETLAPSLPDPRLREAAVMLHTALALRLWGNARAPEAEAQLAIARAVLEKDTPPEMHRDWLLTLGYYRLAVASPLTALPFFEECSRVFPASAEAWLGAGICHELAGFPDGFALSEKPVHDAARQAERCYRQAVGLEPGLAEARMRLGRVLVLTGALDEAEKQLAAAANDPAEPRIAAFAQLFWGGVRDSRGDLPGAIGHYRAALGADRECQAAAFALGEALNRSGRHREAADAVLAALEASRADGISSWQAYHVGSIRKRAPLPIPQGAAPLSVAAQPGGRP
jgi:VWFA-related protein